MKYTPEDWKVDAKIIRDRNSIRSCVSMEHTDREIVIKLDTEKNSNRKQRKNY